jgi:hypothetical protein
MSTGKRRVFEREFKVSAVERFIFPVPAGIFPVPASRKFWPNAWIPASFCCRRVKNGHDLGISLLFFPVLRETHLRRFTAKTAPTPTAPHPLQLDMA